MRKRIFEIIELSEGDDKLSSVYDCIMVAVIVASLVPLAFKNNTTVFQVMDRMCVTIFIADYTLRLLAAGYILLSALVIFNVEPDSFETFFDAVYWATVSLTTMGYGDIYPVTTIGRAVTMVSSMFGIAIVALPAGIVTAGYMSELEKDRE